MDSNFEETTWNQLPRAGEGHIVAAPLQATQLVTG